MHARKTRQRGAILEVLEAEGRPLSTQEILKKAQNKIPNLGIATVYRTIKDFLDAGKVNEIELPGDSQRYEINHDHHHHHFWCRVCDRAFVINGCPGTLNFHPPEGFKTESHEVTFKGICAECYNNKH
ncbi:MAG: transcriptional repressor [Oligoflexales bacterium]|nr:transcriptional repressor [Oligoflexales bacterium]